MLLQLVVGQSTPPHFLTTSPYPKEDSQCSSGELQTDGGHESGCDL